MILLFENVRQNTNFSFVDQQFAASELPTFHWVLVEFCVFIIVEELGFYYVHRLLHHRSLYKHIHKVRKKVLFVRNFILRFFNRKYSCFPVVLLLKWAHLSFESDTPRRSLVRRVVGPKGRWSEGSLVVGAWVLDRYAYPEFRHLLARN